MSDYTLEQITTIVGLGNPGPRFELTRHNVGFLYADMVVDRFAGQWRQGPDCLYAQIMVPSADGMRTMRVVKPQTFMNNSGDIWPWLSKKGVSPEQMLIVHDELEKKFGHLMIRHGGSARGHNGLRSFIARCGAEFWRLRIGIDRPEDKATVAQYVLRPFTLEEQDDLPQVLEKALALSGFE